MDEQKEMAVSERPENAFPDDMARKLIAKALEKVEIYSESADIEIANKYAELAQKLATLL